VLGSNIVEMYRKGYSVGHIVDVVYSLSASTHTKDKPTKLTRKEAKEKVQHEICEYLLEKQKENPPADTSGKAV